jgi:hypothetical protein
VKDTTGLDNWRKMLHIEDSGQHKWGRTPVTKGHLSKFSGLGNETGNNAEEHR